MMTFGARLEKIVRDIWDNKKRSLLVIMTLTIGVAAVGTINNAVRMMERDMFDQYPSRNPAHLTLYVSPFPESLARDVLGLREVAYAQAQRTALVFTNDADGKSTDVNLLAAPDFSAMNINRLKLDAGSATPGLRGILIERSSARGMDLGVGDQLAVETEAGQHYTLQVDGIVHDMTTEPYSMTGEVLGYVSMATLEWMGFDPSYNQIQVALNQPFPSRERVLEVGALARDRIIEPGGYQVGALLVRGDPDPGEYWAKRQADGVLFVLQVMSILGVLLSAGLVVNTISAVLVQQTRQIGVMRSVGATRRQIAMLYLGFTLALSLAALAVALPLGLVGSTGLMAIASDFLNFDITAIDLPPSILFLQIGLGLAMPLGAAVLPILRGANMSVYDAVYQQGLGAGGDQKGWVERQLLRIRRISPPVMLSLRNTFRNPSRLAFTIGTLTIAGATFMAVFSSYTTIQQQVEELGRYIAFDASLNIPNGADRHTVEREALRIPDVRVAEGWASVNAVIVLPDGSESDRIEIAGVPPDSKTILPRLVQGRWLKPGEDNTVVVNEDLLTRNPQVQVNQPVKIKINGQERTVQVVGVASKHMTGARMYMDYEQAMRLIGQRNQVQVVRVLATPGTFSSPAQQSRIGRQLEKRFEDTQLSDASSRTRAEIFTATSKAFNILLVILMLVAGILAVIGGLGLTGAMGLNVLERTREIGVLRAVGASHRSVRQVVVVEGAAVALVSWLLAALLSYPVGYLLAGAVVRMAFGTQPTFQYSLLGPLVWFGLALLIGVLASLAPARDAVRLTVREVLNYE
jgi:putative ABC transport system permease protein